MGIGLCLLGLGRAIDVQIALVQNMILTFELN